MKTYIGMNEEGERTYAEWELKKGKFTCGMETWNIAGDDINMCGRITNELAEEFPKNEQLFMMTRLAKYHLNTMKSGSPKQRELVDTVIGPAYEVLKGRITTSKNSYNVVQRKIKDRLIKARSNVHQTEGVLWGWFEKWFEDKKQIHIKNRKLEDQGKRFRGKSFLESSTSIYVGMKELLPFGGHGEHKRFSISPKEKEILYNKKEYQLPRRYDYVCTELEKLGRLRDPDFIQEGVAYRYGSSWLKEDLPPEVVEEIESWVEVQFTGKTPLQILCAEFKIILSSSGFDGKRDQNAWNLLIDTGATWPLKFEYFTGTGIDTKSVTAEQALGAVISDASYGRDGFDTALSHCADMGYEVVEANKVATALWDTARKLENCGMVERILELGVWDNAK